MFERNSDHSLANTETKDLSPKPHTSMSAIIIGTAGHIDHGKSALVRALTGTDPDRLPEEKKRGITIDLGFADLELDGIRFGFVDVPGHERFVKNMLAGAHGIDYSPGDCGRRRSDAANSGTL